MYVQNSSPKEFPKEFLNEFPKEVLNEFPIEFPIEFPKELIIDRNLFTQKLLFAPSILNPRLEFKRFFELITVDTLWEF